MKENGRAGKCEKREGKRKWKGQRMKKKGDEGRRIGMEWRGEGEEGKKGKGNGAWSLYNLIRNENVKNRYHADLRFDLRQTQTKMILIPRSILHILYHRIRCIRGNEKLFAIFLWVILCEVKTGVCVECLLDISFVIDHSGSIRDTNAPGVDNWRYIIDFMVKIVKSLNVSTDGSHVAAVSFGTSDLPQRYFYTNDSLIGLLFDDCWSIGHSAVLCNWYVDTIEIMAAGWRLYRVKYVTPTSITPESWNLEMIFGWVKLSCTLKNRRHQCEQGGFVTTLGQRQLVKKGCGNNRFKSFITITGYKIKILFILG